MRRFGKLHATLPPQPPIANIVDSSSLRLIPKEPLTKSQEQLLKAKLPDDQPGEQVVCVLFGVKLTFNEFRTLDSEQWLNDEIVNVYCQLLLARYNEAQANELHVFSSFFYSTLVNSKSGYRHQEVAKWTANVDIFSKRFVFFPMNDNNHWTLAVADIRIKTLLFFDSLSRAREDKKKKGRDGKGFLRNLYRYLKDEHLLRKNTNIRGDEWTLISILQAIPQHTNYFDCGVFLCTLSTC